MRAILPVSALCLVMTRETESKSTPLCAKNEIYTKYLDGLVVSCGKMASQT